MDEQGWLASTDPQAMLAFLQEVPDVSDRKLRLFGVACVRQAWDALSDERCRRGVEVAENFADGRACFREMEDARRAAWDVVWCGPDPAAWTVALESSWDAAGAGMPAAVDRLLRASLLREIFGNPFRPRPALPPLLLQRQDGVIPQLAEQAYEDRRLPEGTLEAVRLAVLADALEEAGVQNTDLLQHLRSPGPHVRGCFALDAVLGRA